VTAVRILGSIVSPCRQCGATGLRPTFGRVSRHDCMTLTWSMDKVGSIARCVEDCALVFGAIHGLGRSGPQRRRSAFLLADAARPVLAARRLRGGASGCQGPRRLARAPRPGCPTGAPIKLPDKYPVSALRIILDTEAAAAFDELTRQGITEGLNSWPLTFRRGQFVPAVEYLRANRIRSLLMQEMESVISQVDAYVGGNDLLITNLTGHPTVVMPNGFRKTSMIETPTAITFTGRLYGETELLALANAFQRATGFHLRRPPMDKLLATESP
jgi:Asp-tRNA(Asn)/Glu-tRNA(Gln) amidotransferase A subunit family amidase